MNWPDVVRVSEWLFLSYFLAINLAYIALNIICVFALRNYMPMRVLDDMPHLYSGLELPVSIIVPAFNERSTITASVLSMLHMYYPLFEIVIVNDGSTDGTLAELQRQLELTHFPLAYRRRLESKPLRGVYVSERYPSIRVIDKENGGKADSINAGINAARYPLFCVVDADSVLQPDSLRKIVQPFLEDQRVVAAGGTVRVANGCEVRGGFIRRTGLPRSWLAMMQVTEYIRAFLMGRLGWSAIDGLLIISGAFGVFRKETVIEAGGFRRDTVGEDMDLVVRIHRVLRQRRKPYRVVFLPDPVAWTEVPESWGILKNQRKRWQRGLSESLMGNLGLLFSRGGGAPGWLAFPFMLIFEWIGPVIEVTGYLLMAIFFALGYISWPIFAIFVFAAIGLGLLVSLSALLLEEMSFHLYEQPRQMGRLVVACVLENFGFRQTITLWRLLGLINWVVRRRGRWGAMTRTATWQQPGGPAR